MIRKFIVLAAAAAIGLSSCSVQSAKPVDTRELNIMGTVITQRIYGANADRAAAQVTARLRAIEAKMTVRSPGSEIDRLNDYSGKGAVSLSPESLYVMETARKYSSLSSGAFDITIGPLVKAWGVFTDHPRVPAGEELERLKALTGWRDLAIDMNKGCAGLADAGQSVDLGGIAKGYAGDEAIRIYKSLGIKSAFINLGGNVVVLGRRPDGSLWRIGVQDPRAPQGRYLGIIRTADRAIVSSGDYERYFEKDGVKYHHILDPKTGYPAASGLIATTIVAAGSIDADALSTATFVLGLDKGRKLVESLNGVEALFITADKKVYATKGMKDIFEFYDESKEYTYVEEG